jgi:hypothetical protein
MSTDNEVPVGALAASVQRPARRDGPRIGASTPPGLALVGRRPEAASGSLHRPSVSHGRSRDSRSGRVWTGPTCSVGQLAPPTYRTFYMWVSRAARTPPRLWTRRHRLSLVRRRVQVTVGHYSTGHATVRPTTVAVGTRAAHTPVGPPHTHRISGRTDPILRPDSTEFHRVSQWARCYSSSDSSSV